MAQNSSIGLIAERDQASVVTARVAAQFGVILWVHQPCEPEVHEGLLCLNG
jgi:hypothetical protein